MTLPLDIRPFFSGDQLGFSATGLPQGLAIDPVTGVISGTPTTVETRAVTVTATNPAGQASQGFTWTITAAAGVPGQVTGLAATPGDGAVALAWTAPSDNGAALTDYVIEQSVAGGAFTVIADGTGTGTAFTDTGLTNGTLHAYRVSAVNNTGTGTPSTVVEATPAAAGSAVAIAAFDHGADPGSASIYTFSGIALGTGTAVIGVSARGSGGGVGFSAVTVDGQAATPIGAALTDTAVNQSQNFFALDGVSAGTVDITVTLSKAVSRCGVHVWTLEGGDLGAAVKAQAFSGSATGSASVDVPENGAVLALGTVVTPSAPELVWAGLTERQPWTDYGDTYGAGTADALFASAAPGHQVSAAFGGALGMLAVLAVPPV